MSAEALHYLSLLDLSARLKAGAITPLAVTEAILARMAQHDGTLKSYTTVLTVMQKLDKSGWLTHREEGRAYVYRPTKTRDEAGRSSLRQFIDRICGGNPIAAFQHLLADEDLSADDLAALRKMIDKRRKELSNE